jgi:acetate kinase
MGVFPDATLAMAFETAFFVNLPESERRYAIGDASLRRYGYHGLFHQAACMQSEGRRSSGCTRTLSLCLEPRPELAAVIDHTPIMVTSGTTPLEGLPGETTCGEIDPSIILTLAKQLKWGPEQINTLLTRQSGMFGLTGRHVRLGKVMAACSARNDPDGPLDSHGGNRVALACAVLAYRILLAAGAGVAAMGGVDRIVMSGQYVHLGRALAGWLSKRLQAACRHGRRPPVVENKDSLARILADQVTARPSMFVG